MKKKNTTFYCPESIQGWGNKSVAVMKERKGEREKKMREQETVFSVANWHLQTPRKKWQQSGVFFSFLFQKAIFGIQFFWRGERVYCNCRFGIFLAKKSGHLTLWQRCLPAAKPSGHKTQLVVVAVVVVVFNINLRPDLTFYCLQNPFLNRTFLFFFFLGMMQKKSWTEHKQLFLQL